MFFPIVFFRKPDTDKYKRDMLSMQCVAIGFCIFFAIYSNVIMHHKKIEHFAQCLLYYIEYFHRDVSINAC
jgi:hypothetical protein